MRWLRTDVFELILRRPQKRGSISPIILDEGRIVQVTPVRRRAGQRAGGIGGRNWAARCVRSGYTEE